MKKLLILLILAIGNINAEVIREGDTFKVEASADTQTKYTWEDKSGNKYPIFITKKGACYVYKTSKKTGKKYKYYLPKNIQAQIKKEFGLIGK